MIPESLWVQVLTPLLTECLQVLVPEQVGEQCPGPIPALSNSQPSCKKPDTWLKCPAPSFLLYVWDTQADSSVEADDDVAHKPDCSQELLSS